MESMSRPEADTGRSDLLNLLETQCYLAGNTKCGVLHINDSCVEPVLWTRQSLQPMQAVLS